ncbi:MAG TPA: DnaJ domain-containing protein [Clostridiales bacterium]|nr:DnaJ domain-containing protein [Clostridiales bacterium]
MATPFEILGVAEDADAKQVKAAYHHRAKQCHPDLFADAHEQDEAHRRMVALNVAYKEALRIAANRKPKFQKMPLQQALASAERLLKQTQYESALCQLGRADKRDAQWYDLNGRILLKLNQYDSAHQSFREAVKIEPDNLDFRRNALAAAVQVRKRSNAVGRVLHGIADTIRLSRRK